MRHLEKKIVRSNIIAGQPRIDGRDNNTVRSIYVETGVLPTNPWFCLIYAWRNTGACCSNLGTYRDAQMIDGLTGSIKDPLCCIITFPPFCVGETGFVGRPKRREIGHGRLARRGVQLFYQKKKIFHMQFALYLRLQNPMVLLRWLQFAVPACLDGCWCALKAPVAGIAMGLIKEDNGLPY